MKTNTLPMAKPAFAAYSAFVAIAWYACSTLAHATVWNGGDIQDGIPAAAGVNTGGGGEDDPRAIALRLLYTVLSYMGLVAVVVLVISGIMLVFGLGSDESRERTQKIVLYVFVGLIVILLASAFVRLIEDFSFNNV